MRRLGVFHWEDRAGFDEKRPGIFRALAARGWREGETLGLEWKQAQVDSPRIARAVSELVAASPHAILTESTVLTRALSQATSSVPIVTNVGDPVAAGFARSLGRPGRNITGLCGLGEGFEAKSLELLRAFAPRLSSIMLLFYSPIGGSRHFTDRFAAAARGMGLSMRLCLVGSLSEAQREVSDAVREGAGAAVIGSFLDEAILPWLAEELPRRRLPAIVANGGQDDRFLLSLEQYHANSALRFATLIDKVFQGTPAAEIAFEQPDSAHVVVHRGIARAMGVEIPAELRLRATRLNRISAAFWPGGFGSRTAPRGAPLPFVRRQRGTDVAERSGGRFHRATPSSTGSTT